MIRTLSAAAAILCASASVLVTKCTIRVYARRMPTSELAKRKDRCVHTAAPMSHSRDDNTIYGWSTADNRHRMHRIQLEMLH